MEQLSSIPFSRVSGNEMWSPIPERATLKSLVGKSIKGTLSSGLVTVELGFDGSVGFH